jgi:hypothetical protein
VLRRELDLAPQKETLALYADVLANRVQERSPTPGRDGHPGESIRLPTAQPTLGKRFVGRDRALEQLRAQFARAEKGRGRLILVSGEAGVGKTRLVAEFAGEARGRGAAVLWGGSGAHANRLAHGPFAVAVEGYVASRPSSERNELALRHPALAQFVPSLGMNTPRSPLADRPGDDHLGLLPAMARLLTDLARTRPVCLVVGDLHDAHPSSLDMLQYLTHLAVQRRWLLIGTIREEEVGAGTELHRTIEATVRERLCLHVDLERLDRPDCDRLVRSTLPGGRVCDTLLEQIYAWSLGNPLFANELVREMQERSELVLSNGSWRTSASVSAHVPTRVRALVAMRLAPLNETVRRVLALAAAAGEVEASLTDLRAGAAALQPPISDAALFDALDRALQSRILEERNDAYAFRHPLVRAALYEDLAKHRRDQLHAVLGSSPAEPPHRLHLATAPRARTSRRAG